MRFLSIFWLLPFILLGKILSIDQLNAQTGGYPGSYLRGGIGVRAQGMGGAYVGLADEVTAVYWNPAGLAQIEGNQFGVMWSILTLERHFNYAALAFPLSNLGTFAMSWIEYRVEGIQARDQAGALVDRFSNDENALLFSYGMRVRDYLSFGLTSKIFLHKLLNNSATGGGFDFGLQVKPLDIMNIGLSIQNIFTSITWDTETERQEFFPHIGRLGVHLFLRENINLCIDFELYNPPAFDWKAPKNLYGEWHFGGEVSVGNGLMIRGGIDDGRLTFGTSFLLKTKNTLEFQYAFSEDPIDFNSVHRFGFLIEFQSSKIAAKTEKLLEQRGERRLFAAKIMNSQGDYITIDLGEKHGLKVGMKLKLYSKNFAPSKILMVSHAMVIELRKSHAILKIENSDFLSNLRIGIKIAVEFYSVD